MMKLLDRENAPFLLLLIFSSLGWLVTHVVSRTLETPTIEVFHDTSTTSQKIERCSDQSNLETDKILHVYKLTNISKTTLFEEVSFLVTLKNYQGEIKGIRLYADAPATVGDQKPTCSDKHAWFPDLTIHPGWSLYLSVLTSPDAKPELRLDAADEPVNLKPASLETWLVKNESMVLFIMAAILFLLASWYLFILGKVPVNPIKQPEPENQNKGPNND